MGLRLFLKIAVDQEDDMCDSMDFIAQFTG